MENHYSKLGSKYKSKTHNPNYGKTHEIDMRFRMVIVGASGSGKTNCLMNLLRLAFNNTYSHIYLCIPNRDEPLYNQLIDKLGDDITVYEDGVVPPLDSIEKVAGEERLIIFDDLVNNKQATSVITDYFKSGRKQNLSCVYLSQSWYRIDSFIRAQTNYIIIKKIASMRDLRLIVKEFSFKVDVDELEDMYHYATKKFEDVLLLDVLHSKIYHNFMDRLL